MAWLYSYLPRSPVGGPGVHPFCVYSYDGRAKFPTGLRTVGWSTSQLSLVCERATASKISGRLSLEWITCVPSGTAFYKNNNSEYSCYRKMKRQPGLYFRRDRRFWSRLDWRCPGWTGNAWAGLDR
ncbi:unnamed protein product [Prunus armeniaca]